MPKGSEHSSLFLHGLYQGTQQSAKMHPLQGLGRRPESLQFLPEIFGPLLVTIVSPKRPNYTYIVHYLFQMCLKHCKTVTSFAFLEGKKMGLCDCKN